MWGGCRENGWEDGCREGTDSKGLTLSRPHLRRVAVLGRNKAGRAEDHVASRVGVGRLQGEMEEAE